MRVVDLVGLRNGISSCPRKPYPSDASEEEWAFVAPYEKLMRPDAPQRWHDLREDFNTLRWMVRSGSTWSYLPTNFPPCEAVYQQYRRWLDAEVLAAMTHDLREQPRWTYGRDPDPQRGDFRQQHAAIDPGERHQSWV